MRIDSYAGGAGLPLPGATPGASPETLPAATPQPAPGARIEGSGSAQWSAHRGHGGHPGHVHPPGQTDSQAPPSDSTPGTERLDVHINLLDENNRQAQTIRARLASANVFAVNLMSSPGAGKTALLEATLPRLTGLRVGVIEGDIETSADADRLAGFGIDVVQINTGPFGGDCHLGAPLVDQALSKLPLADLDLVFVENVGNLVCPAEFDIGENKKVVLLSLTEGEDKPLKYPLMFRESDLALLTKTDLAPFLDADLELARANIRRVNPELDVLCISAKTGEGIDEWLGWLHSEMGRVGR
ncbi:MAG: hydrogenase nickel incorporation protein HypB [Thermoleophilia bacterium]